MANDIDHERRRFLSAAAMTIVAAHVATLGTAEAAPREPRELAALGHANEWLNSPRLTPESLSGKVVLVDFWTYTCINWLRAAVDQYDRPIDATPSTLCNRTCQQAIEGVPRVQHMHQQIDVDRRRFLSAAAAAIAAARLAAVGGSGAQSAGTATFGELKQIDAGVLNIGYAALGPPHGGAVVLLHGWPYDIHSYVDVAPLLASAGYRVIVPYLRGYGTTRFLSSDTFRNGQQSALAADVVALMDALAIDAAIVAGFDWGARTANIVAALWPERCKAMVSVSGYLIGSREANKVPLPPQAELEWWYQYYFATDRGRAGYEKYRDEFARLIWRTASPQWRFDDATFDRTAKAFNNPDHVGLVIHNYRWRLGLAEGESKYDELETRLAAGPVITVPTVTLEGDANGAPHPDPASYVKKFAGKYAHRLLKGGIGHNLPQEAPQAFAKAVIDVDALAAGRRTQG